MCNWINTVRRAAARWMVGCTLVISGIAGMPTLAAVDSTALRSERNVGFLQRATVLGSVNDGMACHYREEDERVHCVHDGSGTAERLATELSVPEFKGTGHNKIGIFEIGQGEVYAFAPVESSTTGENGLVEHCRLALQFLTEANEIIWIWHDELRFDGSGQFALIDTDGDNLPDLAVSGKWNGRLRGSNRWSSDTAAEKDLAESETSFPTRPTFGIVEGTRNRSCVPEGVKVARLHGAQGQMKLSVEGAVDIWDSIDRP